MKYFLAIFILAFLTFHSLAQVTPSEQGDPVTECIVYYVDSKEKAVKLDEDELLKKAEVGRFLPTFGGERTLTVKRFRVSKSNLYIFASVFYEDDLFYNDALHDAMTLKISITNSTAENPKSWIAFAEMQIEYRDDFGAANISALVNRKGKESAISMSCQRKKP